MSIAESWARWACVTVGLALGWELLDDDADVPATLSGWWEARFMVAGLTGAVRASADALVVETPINQDTVAFHEWLTAIVDTLGRVRISSAPDPRSGNVYVVTLGPMTPEQGIAWLVRTEGP